MGLRALLELFFGSPWVSVNFRLRRAGVSGSCSVNRFFLLILFDKD